MDEATDCATAGEDERVAVLCCGDAQDVVIRRVVMVQYNPNTRIFLINHNLYKCFLQRDVNYHCNKVYAIVLCHCH